MFQEKKKKIEKLDGQGTFRNKVLYVNVNKTFLEYFFVSWEYICILFT